MYKKFVVRILIAVSLLLTASGYTFANEIPDFSNLQGQPVEKGFMGFTVEKPHGTIIARAFANECDGLVVEWGRQNNCSGYQIQCSTSPLYFENTRSVFVYGKINTKCKINHLAKGGIYYVRVRTFYKNGKSFVYSRWSNRKKVEIPLAVILTASDYQKDKRDPSSIFENILDRIYDDNYRISNVILCGDYSRKHGSYGLKADNYVNQIKEILKNKDSAIDADGGIYVQGNHDRWSDTLTRDGLYYYKDYIVYVMNTGSSNPNHQGSEDQQYVMKKTADRLKRDMQKLIDDHEDRPVIIASHVPLHYSVRTSGKHGDNMYSKYLFDAVNKAGKKLNIVFLFGHNHSAGYDNYIGASCVYLHKGDRIELPFPNAEDSAKGCTSRHSSKTLNFTYMNAGYVGYMGKNASNSILSCGVIKVFNDRLEIVRYGELGKTDLSGEKR